ncbi:MAG: right-handed parallel beta-helix repeat-containing protein, partial [Bacteroidales bacterium]|nr:right-handed parallel beta-helix repeat-containing protein [Bacteroidales bacterium]
MKKIILLFLILFSSISIFGQLDGDGLTPGTAYWGNLNSGTMTWNFTSHPTGIVYVGQSALLRRDVLVSGTGRLIIEGGITVIFNYANSDLRIENGGVLQAIGTPMDKITFTKSSSSTSWGHLAFQKSPGTSVLDHCIIENGTAPAIDFSSGGGIYADCNNLTISNSLIRNNYAQISGGGIYARGSVKIENCIILSNTAGGADVTDGGGGVYIDSGASVANCTFIDNVSAELGLGDDIFFASANATVRNTLIWRTSTYGFSVYFADSPLSSNLTNCAFYEAWDNTFNEIDPSFFVSSFKLNPINDADDCPNFINPAGNDYHILLKSPCVNAGTNQGTPPPPAYDFDG